MSTVDLFMLLPESQPSNQWMRSNDAFQSEAGLNGFVISLDDKLKAIAIETFTGYYDERNVVNFLADFTVLEEYYPTPAARLLRSSLRSFYDWRPKAVQSKKSSYFIYGQEISDHTFCETSQRQVNDPTNSYVVFDHNSHVLGSEITISFDNHNRIVTSLSSKTGIVEWFNRNRSPARSFQVIDKHGENRQDVRIIKGEVVSPLRCSGEEARTLLQSALGHRIDELFNLDKGRGYYIVFKYEGDNPQSMYHGYHVSLDSNEVPADIKSKLLEQNK